MSTEGQGNYLIDVQRAMYKLFLVGFQPAIMSNIKYDDNLSLVMYWLYWSSSVKMTKAIVIKSI